MDARNFTINGREFRTEPGFLPLNGDFYEYDRDTVYLQTDTGKWAKAGTTPAGDTAAQDRLAEVWTTTYAELLHG